MIFGSTPCAEIEYEDDQKRLAGNLFNPGFEHDVGYLGPTVIELGWVFSSRLMPIRLVNNAPHSAGAPIAPKLSPTCQPWSTRRPMASGPRKEPNRPRPKIGRAHV